MLSPRSQLFLPISMPNKLIKSVLWSGLGLIALTVALLGVGKAVAGQRKAEMDAIDRHE